MSRTLAVSLLALLLAPSVFTPSAWADDQSAPALQKPDRLAAIRSRNNLRVCIWPQYYAITFRNPRDGQLSGIDIDLARAFAADLGVGIQFIDSSFAAFMDDLAQDRCDIAMFAIGINPTRAARVDFSKPHIASGIYAVTTKTNRQVQAWSDIDRPGRVVAVAAGTFMEPVMRESLKSADLMVVRPPATREDEVVSGRADLFVTDYPYSQRMLFQHDWARVVAPPQPLAVTPYAFAISKDQPAWLARINAFVDAAKQDGRVRAAAKAHGLEPILMQE